MKKLLTLIFLSMIAFNAVHAEITWTLSNDGTLTISGTDMPNYDNYNGWTGAPWRSQSYNIKNVVIEDGVTNIGDYAFYSCTLTSISIPNSVTSIGDYAFSYSDLISIDIPNSVTSIGNFVFAVCGSLKSITIPNSVTSIGEEAFESCSSLESITIPNSVTSIVDGAFAGCWSLKSIIVPNSVTSIGDHVFGGCESLESITLPNTITSIGRRSFYGCENLTSIIIPNSVTSIGEEAFYECESLTSITIPSSITTIDKQAFYRCSGLTSISVEENNPKYDSRNNCNAIIETESNTLLVGCKNTTIPNSVINVGSYAFASCSDLTSITIPNSVKSIGNEAFSGCDGLSSIAIPNSVTSIGEEAFAYCSNLASVSLGNSVAVIGNSAFCWCGNLTSITIPNSVTSIGNGAFYYCKTLTSVTIQNSMTSIGNSAFSECPELTSVDFGNSVTSIGSWAFSDCSGMTSIIIPNSVTSIGDYAFIRCSNLAYVTIGNSVTSIGKYAFYECSFTSITIPNSVTSIGERIFDCCSALTSISVDCNNPRYDSRDNCNAIIETESNTLLKGCKNTVIPYSVKSIGSSAFNNCSGLVSITIPSTVTSIGNSAFSGCSDLISIICEAITPPNCGNACFNKVDKSIPLYVHVNSIDTYKSTNVWQDFTNVRALPYILTDGEPYTNNSQFDGLDIFYIRTFSNTAWQALYIPFSMSYDDWKNDFDVAYINGIRQIDTDNDNVIDETIMDVFKIEEGSLIPNTPYLIRSKTIGKKTISVSDASLYQSEENSIDCSTTIAKYTFTGTCGYIDAETLIENGYYAMGGGSIIMTDGESDLKPLRWYLKVEARSPMYNVANAAKSITIRVKGEENGTTGIAEQNVVNDKSPIYDLNGRVVNKAALKAGMYIKNGKKIIIK